MAKLGLARSRYYFERDEIQKAINDVLAVMVLGRHGGRDGGPLCTLFQISIDKMAQDVLSKNLWRMDETQLISLQKGLLMLPGVYTLVDAIKTERKLLQWWIDLAESQGLYEVRKQLRMIMPNVERSVIKGGGDSKKGFIAMVEDCEPLFDAYERYVQVLPMQMDTEWDKFVKQLREAENPIAEMSLATGDLMRQREVRYLVRVAMVDAMVCYRLEGREGFEKARDPYDGESFEMVETEEGLVIRSRFKEVDGTPVELVFYKTD